MTTTMDSSTRGSDLPQPLMSAQVAMHFPDVQEMLRRLSAYHLGICMPHMHDAHTGDFQAMPDAIIQVESGLQVSFRSSQEIAAQADRFLPVAWVWRDGAPTPVAACEMDEPDDPGDAGRYVKHKMIRGN